MVSVDSAQVYRGMDIGTAKPGAAESGPRPRTGLIDILDPAERLLRRRFRDDALAQIAAIRRAGPAYRCWSAAPCSTSGRSSTAWRHLTDADPAVRADDSRQRPGHHGWAALHQRLAALDPQTAARLHPNDAQRIQRALEVYRAHRP
ncbi:MAG: hypothetical protein U5L11_11215 [Arhodomonas sp.]|nr:hypothetical protein [Arhodomonas sp.]